MNPRPTRRLRRRLRRRALLASITTLTACWLLAFAASAASPPAPGASPGDTQARSTPTTSPSTTPTFGSPTSSPTSPQPTTDTTPTPPVIVVSPVPLDTPTPTPPPPSPSPSPTAVVDTTPSVVPLAGGGVADQSTPSPVADTAASSAIDTSKGGFPWQLALLGAVLALLAVGALIYGLTPREPVPVTGARPDSPVAFTPTGPQALPRTTARRVRRPLPPGDDPPPLPRRRPR